MSFFGTYKRFEGLVATLCYILVFYTTINFITSKKRLYLLIFSIVAGATISSCYGIAQHLGFDMFKWSSFETRRVFATFGNPVFFSAYLVMVLPLAISLFLNDPSQQKDPSVSKSLNILWIFLVLSLIIFTTFWLTNTRACFVALLGGLIPALILIYKTIPKERYKFTILVISFLSIGIFFNARHETSVIKHFAGDIRVTESSTEKPTFDKIQTIKRPLIANKFSVGGSTFSRIFQYLTATKIIKDYPILGIGPDTIGIVYQRNLAKVFSSQESDKGFQFPRQDRIHNDILDTTVTRGIFGLGTYVWLLVTFGMCIVKKYRQLSNHDKMIILGLLAGIVSYLIQNEFSFGNTPIVTIFWAMMGLCIAIIKVNDKSERLLNKINTNHKPAEENENTHKPPQSSFTKEEYKWKKEKFLNPKIGKKVLGKFSSETKGKTTTRLNICKWLGCGAVLIAMGFAAMFILRVYKAEVYFEHGRRILEFERQTKNTASEDGLLFIRHAILLNPYETFYRDELCRTYIERIQKTKDVTLIQKAYMEANNSLRLIPQHYLGFFQLGMIYQMLSENFSYNTSDEATTYYKKAIESDPFQSIFHSNLASMYIKSGSLDHAIEELCQSYLLRPEESRDIGRLSIAYLQKGDIEKALVFTRKVIEPNPSESGYYNNLGAIYSKKEMYEEAINAFKKAVEINPKDPIYTDNLTKMYLLIGKYDEAISYYKKLIELNPLIADYHNYLGIIYKGKKQPDDAIQSFEKAVELMPDNPNFTYNLASTYFDLGKYTEAKNILQMFNNTYPNHNSIDIYLLLANLYSKNANWQKVVSECEQAIKIDSKSATAYKMLGVAYYNMNQYELAEKMLSQVLTIAPNDQDAKDLLSKLPTKAKKDL